MDLLTKIDEIDNLDIEPPIIDKPTKSTKTDINIKKQNTEINTPQELKAALPKLNLAKTKILDYVLELLDTPLTPKDLKDLIDIIQKLEGKQEDKQQVNVIIQNIMNKFVDDV